MTKKELAARLRIASGTVHFAPAADLSALLIEAADALSPDEPKAPREFWCGVCNTKMSEVSPGQWQHDDVGCLAVNRPTEPKAGRCPVADDGEHKLAQNGPFEPVFCQLCTKGLPVNRTAPHD